MRLGGAPVASGAVLDEHRARGIGERHRETGSEAAVIRTGRTEVGVCGKGGHIVPPHRVTIGNAIATLPKRPGVLASR